ncbi:MAG: PmoA family protein [Pirellulales bacterium]|nr:PmoA family protein [Pirellulales bacterium]
MKSALLVNASLLLTVVFGSPLSADEDPLPDAKRVPAMQVLPLPDDQASFQYQGRELTRYHFGPSLYRPFLYPLAGPAGRSLTRMGHPHDPVGHSHHHSVWISHNDVGGVSFWADRAGRIVHQRIEQFSDGPESAWMLAANAWQAPDGKMLLVERRRMEVRPLAGEDFLACIDLQLEAPPQGPVTLGQTPFGLIGVRMAKTIGVHDGGGRILNSEGQVNEEPVFRKPARWVDYSGPVTDELRGGITLMDHSKNPGHPAPFHVRNDGWMGACLTLNGPMTIEPGKPVRLRYGLWMHAGVPNLRQCEEQWRAFSEVELPVMEKRQP